MDGNTSPVFHDTVAQLTYRASNKSRAIIVCDNLNSKNIYLFITTTKSTTKNVNQD